ncbi:MAG: alpha/beta hydrolase [Clostridia bacterium]|nr:alpha/beta hydrolase [Clostridia bacterium]
MSKKRVFNSILVAVACLMCALVALSFCACDKKTNNIYERDNDFEYTVTDGEDALVYEPKDVKYSYGIIFYVGLFISPNQYGYLAEALAKQGYLVIIPKFEMNDADSGYLETEPAFSKYPNVKFFVGGHDRGGGAAIRRAQENPNSIVGTILFAPWGISKQVFNEKNEPAKDEDGNVIWTVYSIAELSLPTLLLETDCNSWRTEAIVADAKKRLNPNSTKEHILKNSCHYGFLSSPTQSVTIAMEDLTDEELDAQHQSTVSLTLAFMRKTVLKQK